MTWASGNPAAAVELNTDPQFISEGTGSIRARSVVPSNATGTSYVGFRFPVSVPSLEGYRLLFDAWSTEPENTRAFYVRGLNAAGKIVAGWSSWAWPLESGGQRFMLAPGQGNGPMTWETAQILAPDDAIAKLEFIGGSLDKGKPYNFLIDHVRLLPEEIQLHNADTLSGAILTWAGGNPAAVLEQNTDPQFVSEGTGSIHVRSVVPQGTTATSYVAFRIPVNAPDLEQYSLAFRAWSSYPEKTRAFYVRGLNAAGKIVAGWSTWTWPLRSEGETFILSPGKPSGPLQWETAQIKAPGEPITSLEFIVGSLANGEPYDLFVDDIRLIVQEPMPETWVDHGIMAPVGMSTWGDSTLATLDAGGNRTIFTKLWTGNTASYLFINALTGETTQVNPGESGLGAYDVLLTPENVIYDTMGPYLMAIDVPTRTVQRVGNFGSGMSLGGYARAADGTVYAGIYPSATLISYNPGSGQFTNHGPLNQESWPQYLRPLVLDQAGWVYGSIGLQEGQVVAYHPPTGAKVAFIPQAQRQRGQPQLFTGTDGEVYACADGWGWHRLSGGVATPVSSAPVAAPAPERGVFPDGSRITKANIPDRNLFIRDAGATADRELHFDYESPGVTIYNLLSGPDGKIYGSTGVPLRIWSFDPATGTTWNAGLGGYTGHINQFVRQGSLLYGAVYSGGQLVEYDPAQPYEDAPMGQGVNPLLVHQSPAAPDLYGRPAAVLAHPDGHHILVGGKAARVLMGSGMLIYDTAAGTGTVLDRSELLPDHNINAMIALPVGDVLVGTSIQPATAGSPGPATTACLYRFNLSSHAITNVWPMQPATQAIRDMVAAPDGLVYGLAEPSRFFVFDPANGTFIYQQDWNAYGTATAIQAPRCMILGPDGAIYTLFKSAVVRIEPGTFQHQVIAWLPNTISASGMAIHNGRLYFACDSHLWSCALPQP